jgi:hyperosmotically inducible periplasmic protein
MKIHKLALTLLLTLAMTLIATSCNKPEAPNYKASIRQSLDQAGLTDVSVSQDRQKSVVTLAGTVQTDDQKSQAESIAKSIAANQVVANQIAVTPSGDESNAKTINSDEDKAIEKNLDAKLVGLHLQHDVSYDVKNGVVTLKGNVHSQATRTTVEKTASGVPDVKQVVNELEVKNAKATSSR